MKKIVRIQILLPLFFLWGSFVFIANVEQHLTIPLGLTLVTIISQQNRYRKSLLEIQFWPASSNLIKHFILI